MGLGLSVLLLLGIGAVSGAVAGHLSEFRWGYFADAGIGIAGALAGGFVFASLAASAIAAVLLLVAVHCWTGRGALGFIVVFCVAMASRDIHSVYSIERLKNAGPEEWEQTLKASASRLNARLPKMLDENTLAERVVAGPGKQMTYKYRILDRSIDPVDWTQLARSLRESVVQSACRSNRPLHMTRPATRTSFMENELVSVNFGLSSGGSHKETELNIGEL